MKLLPVRQIKVFTLAALCVVASAAFAKKQTKPPAPPTAKTAPAAAAMPAFQKTIGNPKRRSRWKSLAISSVRLAAVFLRPR